jgi:hypothetical protein
MGADASDPETRITPTQSASVASVALCVIAVLAGVPHAGLRWAVIGAAMATLRYYLIPVSVLCQPTIDGHSPPKVTDARANAYDP